MEKLTGMPSENYTRKGDKVNEEKLKGLAEHLGTPSYLFDLERLSNHIRHIREVIGNKYKICFAMKANPFLVSAISEYADRLEVCSPGEYEICIREGIAPDKIVVSGVNKTEESMKRILEYSDGKGIYTIESLYQYEVLKTCFKKKNKRLKVILRLSSGNQFGMDKQTLEKVLDMNGKEGIMDIIGLHFYSGTQKKMKTIKKEIDELNAYALYIKQSYGISKLELEYGPGLAVSYFQGEEQAEEDLLTEFKDSLCGLKEYENICIELGRFLTAGSGYYFTKIEDVKYTNDTKYIIVDGGIHQLNYFGQIMGMKKPHMILVKRKRMKDEPESESDIQETENWQICGSLCTANDVIVRGVTLPFPHKDDVIIFKNVGAYSMTEGMSMFLSRELPQIYIYAEDGIIRCIRKKIETNLLNSRNE